jgi:hypothetical protein
MTFSISLSVIFLEPSLIISSGFDCAMDSSFPRVITLIQSVVELIIKKRNQGLDIIPEPDRMGI